MYSKRKSFSILAVALVLAVVFVLFGPLGVTATAHAREEAVPEQVDGDLSIQASSQDTILVAFTGTSPIPYTDLGGNLIGEGVLVGELVCVGEVCNQKMKFEPVASQPVVYEYKFRSRQAFDPGAGIVVVAGTGSTISSGPKRKFSFTAVFQKNLDGTVDVTYTASRPDASFRFPAAPGTFSILRSN